MLPRSEPLCVTCDQSMKRSGAGMLCASQSAGISDTDGPITSIGVGYFKKLQNRIEEQVTSDGQSNNFSVANCKCPLN